MSNQFKKELKASGEAIGTIIFAILIAVCIAIGIITFKALGIVAKILFGVFLILCVLYFVYYILKWIFLKKEDRKEEDQDD